MKFKQFLYPKIPIINEKEDNKEEIEPINIKNGKRMKFKDYLNEDKFDKILKDENDLIKKYNAISKKHLKTGSLLQDLSDKEFFIWLVGKTFKYGRSFEDSVENAKIHIKNRTKAEKLFGTKKSDLLGFNG